MLGKKKLDKEILKILENTEKKFRDKMFENNFAEKFWD